jgi:hypothetical protein
MTCKAQFKRRFPSVSVPACGFHENTLDMLIALFREIGVRNTLSAELFIAVQSAITARSLPYAAMASRTPESRTRPIHAFAPRTCR